MLLVVSQRANPVIISSRPSIVGLPLDSSAAGWLPEGVTVEQVASGLRPLLDKPVEFVLPTHGDPTDRAALERALRRDPATAS